MHLLHALIACVSAGLHHYGHTGQELTIQRLAPGRDKPPGTPQVEKETEKAEGVEERAPWASRHWAGTPEHPHALRPALPPAQGPHSCLSPESQPSLPPCFPGSCVQSEAPRPSRG